ncbi:MAG: 2-oxoacid:ferredoxin oxidoreductase subunit beta [FCB group bacterium]|nr:2-oxoacid:ferredoxin oxidoreductase subunit beta [FCB group bacterium]
MFRKAKHIRTKYLEQNMWPSIFCQACGIGTVLNCSLRAIDKVGMDIDRTVFVSGIGCSSRLPGYIDADGLHTTHGRALSFATGVKLANPELDVVVFTGDGDLAGIGGNHFIHAARRNVDMTVICINNYNYGMTGAQASPTTPVNGITMTSPYGNIESPFDLSALAIGAGASYVAKWATAFPHETIMAVKKGLEKKGFSFIEVLAPCPIGFGRKNQLKQGKDYLWWYKKNTLGKTKYDRLSEEEKAACDKIIVGELQNIEKPEFCASWFDLVDRQYVK